jgi:hypothetical protein
MKLHLESSDGDGPPVAVIDDESDPQRRDLLFDFMRDVDRNEDLYLAALDRAEAGTPELYWTNHYIDADMYPDGRVVITTTERLLEDDQKDNPPQTVITIAEARKLILDWIEARDKWYAEREATQSHTSDDP